MKIALLVLAILIFTGCRHKPKNIVKQEKKLSLVAIQPYTDFDTSLLPFLASQIAAFYHCNITILSPAKLPSNAYYKPRSRYKADILLRFQQSLLPMGTNAVVGLTSMDISTSNGSISDWGVFGLGSCPGNSCVVSVYRLRSTTTQQFKDRFIKVVLHELGHNLGLPHCNRDSACPMNDAKGTIAR